MTASLAVLLASFLCPTPGIWAVVPESGLSELHPIHEDAETSGSEADSEDGWVDVVAKQDSADDWVDVQNDVEAVTFSSCEERSTTAVPSPNALTSFPEVNPNLTQIVGENNTGVSNIASVDDLVSGTEESVSLYSSEDERAAEFSAGDETARSPRFMSDGRQSSQHHYAGESSHDAESKLTTPKLTWNRNRMSSTKKMRRALGLQKRVGVVFRAFFYIDCFPARCGLVLDLKFLRIILSTTTSISFQFCIYNMERCTYSLESSLRS